jgi:AMMECR1 domain-containing protein
MTVFDIYILQCTQYVHKTKERQTEDAPEIISRQTGLFILLLPSKTLRGAINPSAEKL